MSNSLDIDKEIETLEEQPTASAKNNNGLTKLLIVILSALMLYAYKYPLQRTYDSWSSQHGYNPNGLWIFLGCLALMFFAIKKTKALPKQVNYKGLVLVVLAMIWSLAFKRGDINAMQTIGFIGLIWATFYYLNGWLMGKAVMFPLFLSLFTVQWGLGTSAVSLQLRMWSTKLACGIINVTGSPFDIQVLRQGTNVSMVNIPELAFDVAAACSGLQSLVMTSVLCLLMAHLILKTWWKKLAMASLIVPIAVFNNALRIVLIAYFGSFFTWIEHTFNLAPGWGSETAYGSFHEYPGVVVYSLGFGMVWLASYLLERMPGVERDAILARKAKKAEKVAKAKNNPDDGEEIEEEEEPAKEEVKAFERQPYTKHILVVIISLIVMIYIGKNIKEDIHYTKGLPSIPNRPTLVSSGDAIIKELPYITSMPLSVAGYNKIEVPVSQLELNELPVDTEYFRGLYVTTNNYAAYNKIVKNLLSSSGSISNKVQAILENNFAPALTTNVIENIVGMSEYYRTNLFMISPRGLTQENLNNLRRFQPIIYKTILSRLAQGHRDPLNIMMAIVQNQSDRHSIHTPEACYPGQGWTVGDATIAEVDHSGVKIEAARMDVGFHQEKIKETVLYWYQCEGKNDKKVYATSKYLLLPFKTAMDLIIHARSDRWAFVRFSTGVPDDGSYDESFEHLKKFVKLMEPYLQYTEQ